MHLLSILLSVKPLLAEVSFRNSTLDELGLLLILLAPFLVLVGLVLLIPKQTRKAGGYLLLLSLVVLLVGIGCCGVR